MTFWYISTTGSDSTGNGTSSSPYSTVNKCLNVCVNGDIIKALSGTYSISNITNITKQITITSNSGLSSDTILNSNCTIFNIQNSNIIITNITMQTSSVDPLITIDRMSDGSIKPTFFIGFSISNCIIKYITTALLLNGSFSVTSNTFNRMSGSNVADIIKIYTSRETCNVSNNTFTDSEPVRYLLYFTSDSNTLSSYFDYNNSKGGLINITNNLVNASNITQSATFIYFSYFNQYIFLTSQETNYNTNTKISFNINNNNITTSSRSRFIFLNLTKEDNFKMFGPCNINTNTINNTDYGIIHIGKNTNSTSLTINDYSRAIFKIYNNISDTKDIGLVLSLPLRNDTIDISQYNNTVTSTGITYTTVGGITCAHGPGTSIGTSSGSSIGNYITVAGSSLLKLTGDFSLEFYYYSTVGNGNCLTMLNPSYITGGRFTDGFLIRNVGSNDGVYVGTGRVLYYKSGAIGAANQWHYFKMTRINNVVNVYIDGVVAITPVTKTGTINNDSNALFIFRGDYYDWNGNIRDYKLYNMAIN